MSKLRLAEHKSCGYREIVEGATLFAMATDIEVHAEFQKARAAVLVALTKAASDGSYASVNQLGKAYRALAEGYAWNSNPDQSHG